MRSDQFPRVSFISTFSPAVTLIKMSDYFGSLTKDDAERYLQKLTLESGEKLPDPFTLSGWEEDIKKLPEITWRDVTEYLINTPSVYTKESMKAYKSLEAFDYFVCGHVQECLYHEINKDSNFCFIKSQVSLWIS